MDEQVVVAALIEIEGRIAGAALDITREGDVLMINASESSIARCSGTSSPRSALGEGCAESSSTARSATSRRSERIGV
jgi:hypothetical protein